MKLPLKKVSLIRQVNWLMLTFFMSCGQLFAQSAVSSEPSDMASQSLLLDITSAGKSVIAVGERGHVIQSDDCGRHWQQITVPTRAALTSIYFLNDETGWIVGHDGIIMKTMDGGKHWAIMHEDIAAEQPLFDVLFINEDKGFAVGAYGAFLMTEDGGQHWVSKPLYGEDDFHLYSIVRMQTGELVVSGEAGSVYLSINNGASWEKLKTPYQGSYFGGLIVNNDKLLVFGMRGHIYSSSDLGYSWNKINADTTFALSTGIQLNDQSILLAGDAGVLLASTDQGKTFNSMPSVKRTHKSSLIECIDGGVLAVGEAGAETVRP